MAEIRDRSRPNAGRKRLAIDWAKVDASLAQFLDGVEIAAELGIDPKTLYRRTMQEKKMNFEAYAQKKRAIGAGTIKKSQFRCAVGMVDKSSGNYSVPPSVAMLIWVGKNHLGQSDHTDLTSGGKELAPAQILVTSEKTRSQLEEYIAGKQDRIGNENDESV